ncbi:hypothetical protein PMIN03_012937 [Paraphaeosphaeria minitans]
MKMKMKKNKKKNKKKKRRGKKKEEKKVQGEGEHTNEAPVTFGGALSNLSDKKTPLRLALREENKQDATVHI